MPSRSLVWRGLAAAALVSGAAWLEALQNSPPVLSLRLDPAAPMAGETVRVEAAGAARGAFCQALGRRCPFYPLQDGRWRALVPIPLGIEGTRPLLALGAAPAFARGPASAMGRLDIRERVLPLRLIRLPRGKFKLFSDPGVPAARRRLAEALKTATPEQYWRGRFVLPAPGRATSLFGSPRKLIGGMRYVHKGLDIAAPLGTVVRAANSGVVLLAEPFPLEGRLVLINHGQGVLSVVFHLREIIVKAGQAVAKGQPIGRMGSEGISTGAHVHWGMYVHGQAVDPEQWTRRVF